MSTWISKTAIAVSVGLLGACEGGVDVGLGSAGAVFSRAAPERLTVADNSVIVAGPPGYCIDRSASRDSQTGAFVLLGSCASISRNALQPRPAVPGLLTVTVSGTEADDATVRDMISTLAEFVRTPAGKAALSRSGNPDSIEILETSFVGDALYIHARDRAGSAGDAIDEEYWRALLGIGNRLVTASVVAFSEKPMSREAGLSVLDAFANRMLSENAGQSGQ